MSTKQATDHDAASNGHATDGKVSEAEFLKGEADRARAAISKTLNDFKSSLGRVADPHRLTHDHPFIAVGVAAVAGFVATASLVPSKEQQALSALAAIERSLRQPAEAASEAVAGTKKESATKEAAAAGWVGMLIAEVLKLVRPLITGLITNSLSGIGGSSESKDDADDAMDPDVQPAVSSPS